MSTRIRFGLVMASGAAIVSLLALGPSACTVLTNDAPLDDAGVYEGGDAAVSQCTPCVVDQCTGAWAVCLTDPGCRAVRACATPFAESQGAVNDCVCSVDSGADAATSAQAAYQMFASCNDARTCTSCATDCATSCSGGGAKTTVPSCTDGDAGLDASDTDAGDADTDAGDADTDAAPAPAPVTVDGCASCVAGKCGDPKKQCAPATECAAFLGCVAACSDAACAEDCGSKHATGKAAAESLASCTLAACSAACGL